MISPAAHLWVMLRLLVLSTMPIGNVRRWALICSNIGHVRPSKPSFYSILDTNSFFSISNGSRMQSPWFMAPILSFKCPRKLSAGDEQLVIWGVALDSPEKNSPSRPILGKPHMLESKSHMVQRNENASPTLWSRSSQCGGGNFAGIQWTNSH